jgi:hypothetical protein
MSFFDEQEPALSAGRPLSCSVEVVSGHAGFVGFPPTNARDIVSENGVKTSITVSSFEDRHFVVITQTGKFGTLLSAWAEDKLDGQSKTYNSTVLLGKREDELLNVFAQQIVQKISQTSDTPLLLSIALSDEGREVSTFRQILDTVEELATW